MTNQGRAKQDKQRREKETLFSGSVTISTTTTKMGVALPSWRPNSTGAGRASERTGGFTTALAWGQIRPATQFHG